jgi:hypothetical protein
MIKVKKYQKEDKDVWDNFVQNSKNGTFLFERNFMEYHEDRFIDYSLMIFKDEELFAVLPANLSSQNEVFSHSGLTYGGIVLGKEVRLNLYLVLFREILSFLNLMGIDILKLKLLPIFYSNIPSQENIYALFLVGARIFRVDTSLTILQEEKLSYQSRRIRSIKKVQKLNYSIANGNDFKVFWNDILEPNLMSRFGNKPVHSLAEIELLAEKFPKNISQVNIFVNDKIVAGATIFETKYVAHAQYISASDYGRESGAIDELFNYMITELYNKKKYFDFGICNEQDGKFLNHGLLDWKEGFGGRTFTHEFYEINTTNFSLLDKTIKND